MFFRNELKELMITLKLTKELENQLIKDDVKGISLSDKIKSYEKYCLDDFRDDNDYDKYQGYRNYKKKLLNGNYNNLRWIAHERNQLMHQTNYLIPEFLKFKSVLTKSIKDFKNAKYSNVILEKVFLSTLMFRVILFLMTVVFISYTYYDKYVSNESIFTVVISNFLFFMGTLSIGILSIIITNIIFFSYGFIQRYTSKNKLELFFILLSIIFWNIDYETFLRTIKDLKLIFPILY